MSSPPQFDYPLCLLPEDYGYPVYVRQAAGDVRVDGFLADAWPFRKGFLDEDEKKALGLLGLRNDETPRLFPPTGRKAGYAPTPAWLIPPTDREADVSVIQTPEAPPRLRNVLRNLKALVCRAGPNAPARLEQVYEHLNKDDTPVATFEVERHGEGESVTAWFRPTPLARYMHANGSVLVRVYVYGPEVEAMETETPVVRFLETSTSRHYGYRYRQTQGDESPTRCGIDILHPDDLL